MLLLRVEVMLSRKPNLIRSLISFAIIIFIFTDLHPFWFLLSPFSFPSSSILLIFFLLLLSMPILSPSFYGLYSFPFLISSLLPPPIAPLSISTASLLSPFFFISILRLHHSSYYSPPRPSSYFISSSFTYFVVILFFPAFLSLPPAHHTKLIVFEWSATNNNYANILISNVSSFLFSFKIFRHTILLN